MKKRDQGFTLEELLIVLGILARVTVFAVRGITDQGEESACNADVKTLQTAVESYFAQEGGTTIPTSAAVDAGVTRTTSEGTLEEAGLMVDASANYEVPVDGSIQVVSADCGAPGNTA
ncbi:MAG: prepilin-type N-terminal cleavage/methylation domain-containing protein [Actinomycetota bacterium]